MNEDIDGNEDNNESEFEQVDLKYQVITDDDCVYVKFLGFDNKQQIEEFADYIEQQIALLMYTQGTMH